VETGRRADTVGLPLQGGAVVELHLLQLFDAGKMPVDEDIVGQGPEVFGGLELRRIRQQEEEMDVCCGTRGRTLACHPARSRTSTICLRGPAPTGRANASRWYPVFDRTGKDQPNAFPTKA
jgi:hypothetical protein